MIQKTRERPDKGRADTERASNQNQGKKRYEEFEGMNYEQKREPYNPHNSENRRDDINKDRNEGKRQ